MLRRTLLAMLTASGVALSAAADEAVWKDYLEWYRAQPVNGPDTLKAYLDHLLKSGVGEPERNRRAVTLERLIRERREELHTAFFDRTYAGAPRFNTAPNRLLAETVKGLRPGRALDVHMGQGRNALFLAAQGWDVTGFDYSAEGVRAARKAAEKAGLKLQAIVARHETFDFGQARWDLVVMSYSWVPLSTEYAGKIMQSLKAGGVLVFEHMMDESAGEQRPAPWLPRPNELLKVFGALRILRYEDTRGDADWSWRPERLARLVAEK